MPRYKNDGRPAKFMHTGGSEGSGGGFFQGAKKFNDFKFTSQQSRGIQKKHKCSKGFQRLDDAGDVMMGGEHQASSSGQSSQYNKKMLMCTTSLTNLLWIHEQLKQMHLTTSTDVVQVISDLCEGIQEFFDLSHLYITDIQFRRLFRITETLFVGAIQFHEPEEVGTNVVDIYDRMEHLFDNFLDHINYDKMNIDQKLRGYAFVSGLMLSIRDEQLGKIVVEKLVLRIASTVETMWSTCIFASYSAGSQLLDPDDIDLFYLYCQLLRIAVTSRNWEDKEWLKVSAFQSLLTLEKAASSLFVLLPNLAYILYSTILAASHYSCKDFCDLSLPNAPIQDVQIFD